MGSPLGMQMPTLPDNPPEGFRERFDKLQSDLLDMQRKIDELSETAQSEDNLISVTVGARGEVKQLKLDPRIYRSTDAAALAANITETIWDATRAVTTKLIELTSPMLPPGQAPIDVDAVLAHIPAKGSTR